MKKLTLFFAACLLQVAYCFAQTNLVPNPSFEQYDTCPNNEAEIRYAIGWYRALGNGSGNTPDYYNACDTLPDNFSVPYNCLEGYKPAATGNAYFGIYTYEAPNGDDGKEFFGIQLINPLIKGEKYFVSVKFKPEINVGLCVNYAMNHLGILFSTVSHKYKGYYDTIGANINYAHIYSDSIIKDTNIWTTVSGFFTADSAYKYIIIGNFFDNKHNDSLVYTGYDPCFDSAYTSYYFVDDVMVIDSLNDDITNYSEQDYFKIYPNPFTSLAIIELKSLNLKNTEFRIYDAVGKEVKQQFIYSEKTIIERDNLPQGVYILKISINEQTFFQKLIIN